MYWSSHKCASPAIAILSCKIKEYYIGLFLICLETIKNWHYNVNHLQQASFKNLFAELILAKPGKDMPACCGDFGIKDISAGSTCMI
jgi:hypothetical protein